VAHAQCAGRERGQQKINQDRSFGDKKNTFLGVCDGHGDEGEHVAEYVAECLPTHFALFSKEAGTPRERLKHSIQQVAAFGAGTRYDREYRKYAHYGGTTLVCAYLTETDIWTANIGDSRCVIARTVGEDSTKIEVTALTTDHDPGTPSEKARIEKAGGRVIYDMGGKARVFKGYTKNDQPGGLAMSRSIGDLKTKGVGHDPEIKFHPRHPRDKFLILASDGVWDAFPDQAGKYSMQEACEIVNRHWPDLQKGVDKLVETAKSTWLAVTKNQKMDDITAVVVNLQR